MTWSRFGDEHLDDEKVANAGALGFAMHTAAIVWSNLRLTDGRVPKSKMRTLLDFSRAAIVVEQEGARTVLFGLEAADHVAKENVRVGLFEDAGDAFVVTDFPKYGPPAAAERARREAVSAVRREVGRLGGNARVENLAASKQTASKPQANDPEDPSKTEANPKQTASKPEANGAEVQANGKQTPSKIQPPGSRIPDPGSRSQIPDPGETRAEPREPETPAPDARDPEPETPNPEASAPTPATTDPWGLGPVAESATVPVAPAAASAPSAPSSPASPGPKSARVRSASDPTEAAWAAFRAAYQRHYGGAYLGNSGADMRAAQSLGASATLAARGELELAGEGALSERELVARVLAHWCDAYVGDQTNVYFLGHRHPMRLLPNELPRLGYPKAWALERARPAAPTRPAPAASGRAPALERGGGQPMHPAHDFDNPATFQRRGKEGKS